MAINWEKEKTVTIPKQLVRQGRSCWKAIRWIAYNDNEGSGDTAQEISGYLTACLVADVWNINRLNLAEYIRALRTAQGLP